MRRLFSSRYARVKEEDGAFQVYEFSEFAQAFVPVRKFQLRDNANRVAARVDRFHRARKVAKA